MNWQDSIRTYIPRNEQEAGDQKQILRLFEIYDDLLERTNAFAHMTASAWVTDPSRTKILMAYHNLYDSWAWLGGHCDGDPDLLHTALKEVREESGLRHIRPLSEDIISLEILTVDGHMKKGAWVSSHLHLNVTYLLEADPGEQLHHKADENKAVSWFDMDQAVQMSSEPWFREHVYAKLNGCLREFIRTEGDTGHRSDLLR